MKKIIICMLILNLFLLAACTEVPQEQIEEVPEPEVQVENITEEEPESVEPLVPEPTKPEIEINELSDCNKLFSKEELIDCYADLAIKEENMHVCRNLSVDYKEMLDCYIKYGLEMDDTSVCFRYYGTDVFESGLQDEKIKCYSAFIEKTESVSECEEFPSQYQVACYVKFAIESDDLAVCDGLSPKKDYVSYCYQKYALDKNDISICDELSEQTYKSVCIIPFAIKSNNFSKCDELPEDDRAKCYGGIAAKKYDPTICDKLGNKSLIFCHAVYAAERIDSSVCRRITKSEDMQLCFEMRRYLVKWLSNRFVGHWAQSDDIPKIIRNTLLRNAWFHCYDFKTEKEDWQR